MDDSAVTKQTSDRAWSSRLVFIMAAIGAAVGLGNIWKFPYEAGVSGGGAFVIVYLLCVFLVAIPILIAELFIGRMGGRSPPLAARALALDQGRSSTWSSVGWMGVIVSFIVVSFYSVIAGWALGYIARAPTGFAGDPGENFAAFLSNPGELVFWQFVILAISVTIVSGGIRHGVERAVKVLMPSLLVMLVVLIICAAIIGDFAAGARFLFAVDFSKVSAAVVLEAVGQAFFSVGVAGGLMMAYGAYMSKDISIPRSSLIVGSADTCVALLAGFMIFPLVFAFGLDPAAGPGLIYVSLPHAFQAMPAGGLIGGLFFALLAFAAITTVIAALEPMVAYGEERFSLSRPVVSVLSGVVLFIIGLATVFSFNIWSHIKPLAAFESFANHSIFDLLDYSVTNLLMPLGGVCIAVFVGWRVRPEVLQAEFGESGGRAFWLWLQLIRYLAPVAILAVFWVNLS